MIEKNKVMIKLDRNTPNEVFDELAEAINKAFNYKKVFKDIEENYLFVFSGDERYIAKGVRKLRKNKTFEIYGNCRVRGEKNTAKKNKAREAYIKFTHGYFWETTLEKYIKLTDVDTEAKAIKYLRKQNPIKVFRLANKNSLNAIYPQLHPFCQKFYFNTFVLKIMIVNIILAIFLNDNPFWKYLTYGVNILFIIIESIIRINIWSIYYKECAFILCYKAQELKEDLCIVSSP